LLPEICVLVKVFPAGVPGTEFQYDPV